jgi:hypothetical protein
MSSEHRPKASRAGGPYYAEIGSSYIEMPMTLTRRLFRRFALALATVQLVAFAAAPVLDGMTVAAQVGSGLAVDGPGPDQDFPAHDPGTCIACQLISSVAALPQPASILVPADDAGRREHLPADVPREVFPRQGFLSRAPPAVPA